MPVLCVQQERFLDSNRLGRDIYMSSLYPFASCRSIDTAQLELGIGIGHEERT